jgi:Fe2+ transport system protein FeoA
MEEFKLIDLQPNDVGRVKEIMGCNDAKKRLFELGLNRGAQIQMIKNDIGPIILSMSGHKLALGRGLASKIIIQR